MSIAITKIEKSSDEFSIWINDDQPFNDDLLFSAVASLMIKEQKRVFKSFGPAEVVDDVFTSKGVFSIHTRIDEYPGTIIYSKDQPLMDEIFGLLLSSGMFHERLG